MNSPYRFLIHQDTYRSTGDYLAELQGSLSPGKLLRDQADGLDPSGIGVEDLLQMLVHTKRPQVFAESAIYGDGSDWNQRELSILGDLSVAMKVTIYDEGQHRNPVVHNPPFNGTLIFTPGALLRNGRNRPPADWEEVVRGNEVNQQAYEALYERRLAARIKGPWLRCQVLDAGSLRGYSGTGWAPCWRKLCSVC